MGPQSRLWRKGSRLGWATGQGAGIDPRKGCDMPDDVKRAMMEIRDDSGKLIGCAECEPGEFARLEDQVLADMGFVPKSEVEGGGRKTRRQGAGVGTRDDRSHSD